MTRAPDVTPQPYPTPAHGPGWVGVDNCWHHGYEPIPDAGAYKVCYECGHAYLTADDLRAAYKREIEAMASQPLIPELEALFELMDPLVVPPASDITFCQECFHDF